MIVFGSTGSIGVNVLELAKQHKIAITALACGKNIKLLNKQIAQFKPEFVCVQDRADKTLVDYPKSKVFVAQEGLEKILKLSKDNFVINAIVGFAGLRTSLACKKLGKTLALANKESLVVAGKFLKGMKIIPIDSEHAALNFLLQNQRHVKKLYITASGGAVFKLKTENLKDLDIKTALKHPNWSMGAKITIDSATMANKLFEIIEAYHLYDFSEIDAFIERHSLVHALCEFEDGGMSAYFSKADMKLAISQAILKKNNEKIIENLDPLKLPSIKFHKISSKKYPIFSLKEVLLKHPDLGVIINGANEILVHDFLQGKCKFLDISKGVFKSIEHFGIPKIKDIEDIFEYNIKVKEFLKG
ncbi:1-deoxy-D-xylulose-5-phosphate reductoisomerase [Campylobacter sp. MIT 99-7217]|uniref:1-deoxy-D-xylulose-5-phosphate reductoisomerase n=1 Tax=Campylobacter sp. MIT 99-7217 TaxID=535091 RepID=UPI00115B75FA|nr:1-deoxy-D-xylulose-5-phosphate reductoisomerase [Campylobacter sp. MIT 99-7217]TQR33849.1 1-deoxy-D-xylulose-5-phosphate reductoisomerase [Campylobacter sp. MIT 99-7217]